MTAKFKTKKDVYEFIYNSKCGGCEYCLYDELGEGPDPYNEVCHDCVDWDALYEEIDNMTTEEAIRKFTPGND